MNGPDILGAEDVGQIRGDGGEAAAVHGQDDAEDDDEEGDAAGLPGERGHRVKHETQGEEDEVGALPADVVGEGRPADPAGDIGQTEQRRESGTDAGELGLLLRR